MKENFTLATDKNTADTSLHPGLTTTRTDTPAREADSVFLDLYSVARSCVDEVEVLAGIAGLAIESRDIYDNPRVALEKFAQLFELIQQKCEGVGSELRELANEGWRIIYDDTEDDAFVLSYSQQRRHAVRFAKEK